MSKPTKEQIEKIREIRTKKVIDNNIIRKDGNTRDSKPQSGTDKT